jgi:hypothetical protein
MWEKRNAHRLLVTKPEGRRLIGRSTHWSVENIKIPVRGTGSGVMDRTDVAQHRDHLKALLNMVISLWVPFIHSFILFSSSNHTGDKQLRYRRCP